MARRSAEQARFEAQLQERGRALVEKVLAAIAAGEDLPWRAPWMTGFGLQVSGRSGQRYAGGNLIATFLTALLAGNRGRRWYTRLHVERRKWTLRPDAPSVRIWGPIQDHVDFGSTPHGFQLHEIFNEEGIDGVPPRPSDPDVWQPEIAVARVLSMLQEAGAEIRPSTYAAYHPLGDVVWLPPAASFSSTASWAGTAMHELIHWTGSPHRLGRYRLGRWSDEDRAQEELVAELGAALATLRLRLPAHRAEDDQHVAYLASWAQCLRKRPDRLLAAMLEAIRAVELLATLAPRAFDDPDASFAPLTAAEVPSQVPGGVRWSGDLRAYLPPADAIAERRLERPAAVLPTGARWIEAVLAAGDGPAPALAVVGSPGAGAETVADELGRLAALAIPPLRPGSERHLVPLGRSPLPAAALIDPQGPPGTLPALPAATADAVAWLADAARRTCAVVLAGRARVQPPPAGWLHVLDLDLEPLPAAVAAAQLAKSERRPWIAAAHRHPEVVARLTRWRDRLGSRWLDGRRRRSGQWAPELADTAPFAPVVLVVAQAVLDGELRRGRPPRALGALVSRALADRGAVSPDDLVPLDELFDRTTADLPLEARVAALESLIGGDPEISQGSFSWALLLLPSLSEDPGAWAAEITALRAPRRRR